MRASDALLWSFRLDYELLFHVPGISIIDKIAFICKKYLLFIDHYLRGHNGLNSAKVFGARYFFDDICGLASLQRVYCESYLLKNLVPQNSTIVDVGANVGQFTFFCQQYLKAKKIISIEPVESSFEVLKLNSGDSVICINAMISNDCEVREFFIASESSQLSSYIKANDKPYAECIHLIGKKLDDIIEDSGLEKIDLLKVDTEGSEYDVLLSSKNSLGIIEVILVELSIMRKSVGNIFQTGSFLNKNDFELISLGNLSSDKPEDLDCIFRRK